MIHLVMGSRLSGIKEAPVPDFQSPRRFGTSTFKFFQEPRLSKTYLLLRLKYTHHPGEEITNCQKGKEEFEDMAVELHKQGERGGVERKRLPKNRALELD